MGCGWGSGDSQPQLSGAVFQPDKCNNVKRSNPSVLCVPAAEVMPRSGRSRLDCSWASPSEM